MNIKLFVLSCFIFLILDAGWISLNYKYYNELAIKVQKESIYFKPVAFIIAYILLFTSLYFCLRLIELELLNNNNKNKNKDYLKIIIISVIFGLSVYGIYSYTTCVFLKNYNYTNALIDTLWGGVLYSVPSIIYFSLI